MSKFKRLIRGTWRTAILVAGAGTVLATSCSTAEMKAILAGVQVATDQLTQSQNDNITFGDWLSSELSSH